VSDENRTRLRGDEKTSSWSLVSLNPIGELLQIFLHTLCLYLIGELPFSDDLTGKMQKLLLSVRSERECCSDPSPAAKLRNFGSGVFLQTDKEPAGSGMKQEPAGFSVK
jgi:hypothetical protein